MSQTEELFANLAKIANQPAVDHADQIKKWNDYYSMLDKVADKCYNMPGVRLHMNIKNNLKSYPPRDTFDDNYTGVIVLTVFAIGIGIMFPIPLSFYSGQYALLAVSVFCAAALLYYHLPRLIQPKTLKMSMSPKIHIDELAIARGEIKGFPAASADPIISLPGISIAISRQYLSTFALQKVMNSMADIKLPS